MQIFDAFLFFNELELLEVRLQELAPVVDRFVLVEATQTFSGKPKPLYFHENRGRFSEYADRIIHVVIHDMPEGPDPWAREAFQRNAILRGLSGAAESDVVMISDVDEFPRREVVPRLPRIHTPLMLQQTCYYYWLNCQIVDFDAHFTRITRAGHLAQITPESLRNSATTPMRNAGWHFSYLGGVDRIRQKVQSFSHQEFNRESHLSEANLTRCVREGVDLFGRGQRYRFVPIDDSFPEAIRTDPDRYKDLISLRGCVKQPASSVLDAIASRHGCDKCIGQHGYTHWYEDLWSARRWEPLRIMEFGVGNGASLRMWSEYFPRSRVVALDVDPNCLAFACGGAEVIIASQEDDSSAAKVRHQYPEGFDIIVDDGSHLWAHQQKSLELYFPLLRPGGSYAIEDLHTSYWEGYGRHPQPSTIEHLKLRIDDLMLHGESGWADQTRSESQIARQLSQFERDVESISFYRGLAVLRKRS